MKFNREPHPIWVKLAQQDSSREDQQSATEKLKEAESILESIVGREYAAADMPSDLIMNEAKYELAVCFTRVKKLPTRSDLFEEIAKTPESPLAKEAFANAGRNYLDSKQPKKAIPLLEQATKLDPVNGTLAAHWLAEIYLESNQPNKALDVAKKQINKLKSTKRKTGRLDQSSDGPGRCSFRNPRQTKVFPLRYLTTLQSLIRTVI